MTTAKELRDQSVEELQVLHNELRKELFDARTVAKQRRQSEAPHNTRNVRRDIARVLTVLKQKETSKTVSE